MIGRFSEGPDPAGVSSSIGASSGHCSGFGSCEAYELSKDVASPKASDLGSCDESTGGCSDSWTSVCVSEAAASRLSRVLAGDPGTGVMRHADAGYERALQVAAERGVKTPLVKP